VAEAQIATDWIPCFDADDVLAMETEALTPKATAKPIAFRVIVRNRQ